ncbi:MAG: acetyl/propionyl/methylcrotonyl-CoA carboxylase subunit alpha [Bauldia sp.]|uniref:acetyl-CoA carboxylase biotin carboxylase subunit n=1 Tax=Bauldia sp. TaxID=2575872 RepID=UPI001D5DC918|nr:acetyl/propionyl/methylcrotonyl-CoA carboxylase subunit alpha [Bauldia sp.]MCB1495762.1 acetyl/propionyl/methylcrotonyl-CoA carboxylase subunit alpha [Bauldia sp.]
MFEKILVANRGEIAVRVIRTARRLGIGTVAVYCDADRGALHVEYADEAVNIGPPPASSSYLVIDHILDACRETGADAVHPGYGFLSERTEFAAALKEAGITFIGPNPQAIAAMGDKIESKRLAAAAGVSTIPGHAGAVASEEEAIAVATDVGFPVMLKASAGGGGKGMRIARSADDVAEGFASSQSEARSSFGDDRILIERFVESPRHVEIQVLGDKYGNLIHLGERECSIQRRNQKIIEEAPSPAVDEGVRAEMGGQAVALARAVGYDSAGTVEFIMDPDRNFYFLEMNTRLQVEHPVTELVTGIDLVEQMIRVAAGEKLSLRQDDISLKGWAVESRVYAEDPHRGFLPSIGRLERYRPPAEGETDGNTVRIDGGVGEGSEISIYFDPLIAKLITRGRDRIAAIDMMQGALDRYLIDGIAHNIPFLSALMDHRRWREGRLSTAFIDEEYPDGYSAPDPEGDVATRLAIVAVSIERARRSRLRSMPGRMNGEGAFGRRDWGVRIGERHVALAITEADATAPGHFTIARRGEGETAEPSTVASDWKSGDPLWVGTIGGVSLIVQVRQATAGVRLSWRGFDVVARAMTPRIADLDALMPPKSGGDADRVLRCPMPGLVISILVEPGQTVSAGAPLAVVEAMKMENILRAERNLIVASVNVAPGDVLAVDEIIMEFSGEEAPD